METHSESRAVWVRIATFVGITYVWSWIFMSMAISAGKITTVAALGGMWSPFVGLLVTQMVFPDGRRRGSLGGLGWHWGSTRWQMWSYLLPVLYVGAAHGATWAFGLSGFTNAPAGEIALKVISAIALGTIINSIAALGEEIGWFGRRGDGDHRGPDAEADGEFGGILPDSDGTLYQEYREGAAKVCVRRSPGDQVSC